MNVLFKSPRMTHPLNKVIILQTIKKKCASLPENSADKKPSCLFGLDSINFPTIIDYFRKIQILLMYFLY